MELTFWQAVILGLVQGLTEFLPVSSSGHVLLASELLLGGEDVGSGFSAVIQIGTLLAVLIFFWGDLTRILGAWGRSLVSKEGRGSQDVRIAWGIAAGTVPIVLVAKLLEEQIDTVLRSPWVVVGALAVFGLLMGAAEHFGRQTKTLDDFQIRDGVMMGLWQCLALVPGSSRSGSTITGGLLLGFERATAARISFLMMVPAVGLSGVYKLVTERDELLGAGLMPTVVATVVSFLSGYAAIAFLMKFLQSHTTWVFVVYRVLVALVIAGLLLSGMISG